MDGIMLILPILIPVIGGLLVWCIPVLRDRKKRNIYVFSVLILTVAATLFTCWGNEGVLTLWSFSDKIGVSFKIDGLTRLFATLMSIVCLLVGVFAFEYMKHEENERRFFAFYLIVIGTLNGIYMSSNLITMYLFYEMMTLTSLPLVLHNLSGEAVDAGKKYLFYSIGGAFLSLISIFFICQYSESCEFTPGGFVNMENLAGKEELLLVFVFLAIIGFGCKAGLFPLQDWLPTAHPVAPAPASAMLSGIITKSGVIAIIRIVFYSVGSDLIVGTWVQYAWMILSLVTVFLGSMLAYREKQMKKRFAYSTVSQVSYVLFGLSMLNTAGVLGALLHVIFHSAIKDALFLVAGAIIFKTGKTSVDDLRGIGKRMPVTMWCFTLVSLALVGIPPLSGFISKWYLASGALSADIGAWGYIGTAVLLISALLTAGYLLPVTINGFFPGADFNYAENKRDEVGRLMLIPIVMLTAVTVLFGMFPGCLSEGITQIINSLGL